MRLYVVRHAEAEDTPAGKCDVDRRLTQLGFQQARYVGDALARGGPMLEVPPRAVLTSPAVRATQTAEVIATALGVVVTPEPRLGLSSDVDKVIEVVEGLVELAGDADAAVVVGHNPVLAELVWTVGGRDELRKGELVSLEIDRATRRLVGKELMRLRGPL